MPGPRFLFGVGMPGPRSLLGVTMSRGWVCPWAYQRVLVYQSVAGRYTRGCIRGNRCTRVVGIPDREQVYQGFGGEVGIYLFPLLFCKIKFQECFCYTYTSLIQLTLVFNQIKLKQLPSKTNKNQFECEL